MERGSFFLDGKYILKLLVVKYVVVNTIALVLPYLSIAHLIFHPNKDMSLSEMKMTQDRMSVLVFVIGDRGNRCFLLEAVDYSYPPGEPRKS